MNKRTSNLTLTVVWSDSDLQEVVVAASGGQVSGQVNLYAGPNELSQFAELLRGFPVSQSDTRCFQLGQDDLAAYGKASFTLYCRDSIGHGIIEVALESYSSDSRVRNEACTAQVAVLPSDLDRFAKALLGISGTVGAFASLNNVDAA